MELLSSVFWLMARLCLWILSSLLIYLSILITLILLWRSYKIIYKRNSKIPVSDRDAILITGATSGIGLALAKYLYSMGYSVIAAYYSSEEPGYKELSELRFKRKDRQLILIELDVTNEQSIREAGQTIRGKLGEHQLRLFAVINNAGLGSLQPFAWLQRTTIRQIVEVNLIGSLMVAREFLPLLVKSKGRLLNVASGLGLVAGPTYVTYGLTKRALVYFTEGLNFEMKSFGVKSIAIVPHNFIKNTKICSQNVKNNELAWESLTTEEQQLYNDAFRDHCELAKQLELATAELNRELPSRQQAQPPKGELNQLDLLSRIKDVINSISSALTGINRAKSLEESGALECFEDALRLPDPPEVMFAGDRAFSLLVGSVLLAAPAAFVNLLSESVASGIYK